VLTVAQLEPVEARSYGKKLAAVDLEVAALLDPGNFARPGALRGVKKQKRCAARPRQEAAAVLIGNFFLNFF
jgi:hypothetical protein